MILQFFILMLIFAAWILTIGIVAAVYKAKRALNIWLEIIGMGGFLYPLAIAVFWGLNMELSTNLIWKAISELKFYHTCNVNKI